MQGYELHGRRERTVALAVVRTQTELVRGVGAQVGRDRSTREGEEERQRERGVVVNHVPIAAAFTQLEQVAVHGAAVPLLLGQRVPLEGDGVVRSGDAAGRRGRRGHAGLRLKPLDRRNRLAARVANGELECVVHAAVQLGDSDLVHLLVGEKRGGQCHALLVGKSNYALLVGKSDYALAHHQRVSLDRLSVAARFLPLQLG